MGKKKEKGDLACLRWEAKYLFWGSCNGKQVFKTVWENQGMTLGDISLGEAKGVTTSEA